MLKSTQVCHIAKYTASPTEQNEEGAPARGRVHLKVNVLRINKGEAVAENEVKIICLYKRPSAAHYGEMVFKSE